MRNRGRRTGGAPAKPRRRSKGKKSENIASGLDGPAYHHADDLVTFSKRQRRTVRLSETSEDQTVPA